MTRTTAIKAATDPIKTAAFLIEPPVARRTRKCRKKKTDNPSATQALAAYRGVGWAVLAGLWLMLVAALVSFHPDDAPSHAVGVAADPVHNWVGVVGAALAYELYSVLGFGVWALVIGMAVYLYRTATSRETNQLVLRAIGLTMMAVTISALLAILGNTYALFRSPMPEGTGGLLSLFVNDHLTARFETFGSVVLLLVSFWVGAILTADRIVLAIPKALALSPRLEVKKRRTEVSASRMVFTRSSRPSSQ